MIFVGGLPLEGKSQGSDILTALMEHPVLVCASLSFRAIPEKQLSSYELSTKKHVYIFQGEYATVDPALVDFIGTDEATTCVGLVIRNRQTGLTSVAHMDSPNVIDFGLSQMLSEVVSDNVNAELDVHLVGGFEDVPPKQGLHSNMSESQENLVGHSLPLCAKILEALGDRRENLHILTLFVLGFNTRRDSEGILCPIFNGVMVETSSGSVFPACFINTTRCPDELVRRIRVSESFEDPCLKGKLRDTYNTQTDQFIISPFYWNLHLVHRAYALLELADSEILHICSTSPSAEAPGFVESQRRVWEYLTQHPNWRDTFPSRKPRIFRRTVGGGWMKE